jgi:hypothetical protein
MGTIFKASMTDGPRRIVRDAAQRTLICAFRGKAFVSERNGEDLEIFLVSSDSSLRR